MICLETALPAKFDETIVEALGEHAPRPAASRASRRFPSAVDVMKPDAGAVKRFIADRV